MRRAQVWPHSLSTRRHPVYYKTVGRGQPVVPVLFATRAEHAFSTTSRCGITMWLTWNSGFLFRIQSQTSTAVSPTRVDTPVSRSKRAPTQPDSITDQGVFAPYERIAIDAKRNGFSVPVVFTPGVPLHLKRRENRSPIKWC